MTDSKTVSLRTELLLALAMFFLVTAVSAAFQQPIAIDGGKGWDGAAYYTVALQIRDHQPLSAEAPFVYRVATPLLAQLIAPSDAIRGFEVLNLAANALTTLLLAVWLRQFVKDWRVRAAMVAAFLLEWHGPIRFTLFYPVAVDNWFVTLLLAGLLVIHKAAQRVSWRVIATLSVLTSAAVLFRESGALLGVTALFLTNPLKSRRLVPALVLPLLGGLAVFGALHAIAHSTNTVAPDTAAAPLVALKSPPAYVLGWWTAFGPLLMFPIFAWRASASFLWRHQYMLALLVVLTLMGAIQSPGLQLQLQDTERYLFWGMPVVYVLIARAIEEALPLLSRLAVAVIVVAQAVAERAFWTIPQPGAESAEAFQHSTSAVLLFTPLGNAVRYFDLFPAWMTQTYRLVLLGEYLAFAAVVVAWLLWRARAAHSEPLQRPGRVVAAEPSR